MWRVEGLGLKHLVGVVLSMSGGGTTVGLPEGGIWRKREMGLKRSVHLNRSLYLVLAVLEFIL